MGLIATDQNRFPGATQALSEPGCELKIAASVELATVGGKAVMHILRTPRWRRGEETQRYFPEWADRFERAALQVESDRNSYSAGGYAEEFGYRAQPGLPLPARLLAGQPEGHKLWRTQLSALHPGYPECARPLDRDGLLPWTRAPAEPSHAPAASPAVSASRVIRLRRPAGAESSAWAQLLSMWRVFRVCARHFDGF